MSCGNAKPSVGGLCLVFGHSLPVILDKLRTFEIWSVYELQSVPIAVMTPDLKKWD